MNENYLKLFFAAGAVILFTVTSVQGADMVNMRKVSGEIGWVDVQSGTLELNKETPKGTKTEAYRINQNETRVTDPTDTKYLDVADLRAGQYITIEMADGQEDKIVPKIIVEPSPASEYQQAYGELKAIDVEAGTLSLEEKVRVGQEERTRISYFVFDPQTVVVMRSPSKEPVILMLKPGDVVKVEYAALDGKQQARNITLYSPTVTTTTTTTTTTRQ
jgi:hypothetical protein